MNSQEELATLLRNALRNGLGLVAASDPRLTQIDRLVQTMSDAALAPLIYHLAGEVWDWVDPDECEPAGEAYGLGGDAAYLDALAGVSFRRSVDVSLPADPPVPAGPPRPADSPASTSEPPSDRP